MGTATTTAKREARLDLLFHALGDPTRRAIVQRLAQGEATISELAEPFAMTLPGVTKHLSVLERAGLVRRERRGKSKHCMLDVDALTAADEWLDSCRAYWSDTLDSLAQFVEDDDESLGRST